MTSKMSIRVPLNKDNQQSSLKWTLISLLSSKRMENCMNLTVLKNVQLTMEIVRQNKYWTKDHNK